MDSSIIEREIAAQHIPGLAVAVQQRDAVLYEGYFGHANLEHSVPVIRSTVFEIASVTKLFTAQAVLRLVQDGKIALDKRVTGYVDDLPEAWHPVTVRHCLAHQSGIPDYTRAERYWALCRHDKSARQVLDLVREQPVLFSPGARFSYDNTGFYLLGMMIEAVTQKSYAEYLREIIFDPLGMNHTQANDYEHMIPNRAQGYLYRDESFHNKIFYDTSNTFSAGILLSNVTDLLRWQASFYDDSILNVESRLQWFTRYPSQAANERQNGYTMGLGWFIVDDPIGQIYGHGGSIPGFQTTFVHLRDSDITVAIMCNGEHVVALEKLAIMLIREMKVLE